MGSLEGVQKVTGANQHAVMNLEIVLIHPGFDY